MANLNFTLQNYVIYLNVIQLNNLNSRYAALWYLTITLGIYLCNYLSGMPIIFICKVLTHQLTTVKIHTHTHTNTHAESLAALVYLTLECFCQCPGYHPLTALAHKYIYFHFPFIFFAAAAAAEKLATNLG